MKDQVTSLKLQGVAAETINSSSDRDENVAIWRKVAAGDVSLLYLSPERLMTERMISALQKLDVKLIAVDEVHCMSQWGASFRPEYELLKDLRVAFPGVPIGAFTATADEVTRNDIKAKLFGNKVSEFVSGFDRPNIRLTVQPKNKSSKQLLDFLEDHKNEAGIVYVLSRKSVEETTKLLRESKYNAVAYHAGLTATAREDAQNRFMTEPGIIVVATIAFGMGIDKPDVRFVFHLDLPGTLDAYYQEIGRAGRDGQEAEAHMVFGLSDIRMRRMFIDEEGGGPERARREHKRLDALVAYCETPDCRRQALLAYFGEFSEPCGNCDVCINPADLVEGTPEAKLIFAAMRATGERFGAIHVVDVLTGSNTERVQQRQHNQLTCFGSGKHRTRQDWQSLIRQLIGAGFVVIDVAGFGGISLSKKAESLLAGDIAFRFRPDLVRGQKKATRRAALPPVEHPQADALLARLKTLRLKLAKQRRVPAYAIFADKSLIDMANRRPLTKWDFAEVNGVGAAKLEQFGEVFLAEIADFVRG
jgi:ATP-dependent DNA helicase RecQ